MKNGSQIALAPVHVHFDCADLLAQAVLGRGISPVIFCRIKRVLWTCDFSMSMSISIISIPQAPAESIAVLGSKWGVTFSL